MEPVVLRAFQQLNQNGPEQKEAKVLWPSIHTVYTGPTTELPTIQAEFDTTLQNFPRY